MAIGAVALQSPTHLNFFEIPAADELILRAETIVGPCLLAEGTYVVSCDRELVTFALKSTGERLVELPCVGARLKDPLKGTSAVYERQPSGRMALEKLYIKGSNVEHVF